ncbi:ethanolamine utilization protein EutJ [Olsenella phocaeensis]|uniref:ethanolamine utilization protein EutJ n=1 Tax=Olsenella phocaeensis TaxID=1852385 RepID=UPI000931E22A|nr:ethanolamine utilization protein EutJ [Olsenella phocaeensis]
MSDFDAANRRLEELLSCVDEPRAPRAGKRLYCGLDLGTAFIVLVVLDEDGGPVDCKYQFAGVVRDGMVVDYVGACDIARGLKEQVESELGVELGECAVAIPPQTESLDGGVVRNVAESCGLECTAVFDEPTAANLLLGVQNGAVVDIGGGTTGISVFRDGEVVRCVDESTGGTHFSLVLAGAKGMSFDDAELYKRAPEHHAEVLPIVAPTIDKVTTIIQRACEDYDVPEVVLVGGTAELSGIEGRVASRLGMEVHKPSHPMFVTPMGIALGCALKARERRDA